MLRSRLPPLPRREAPRGTAEDHLRIAAQTGEYVAKGERVRSDGSTFWAGVTLTALRDDHGALLGFTKVARDLTVRSTPDVGTTFSALARVRRGQYVSGRCAPERSLMERTGIGEI
jgi:hypothetical protein